MLRQEEPVPGSPMVTCYSFFTQVAVSATKIMSLPILSWAIHHHLYYSSQERVSALGVSS